MDLVIDPDGAVRLIYGEELDLTDLGPSSLKRASCVEPDSAGHWQADLAPVGGPRLAPVLKRSQAIAAEVAWLRVHWLV